jgi:hypothetical protein
VWVADYFERELCEQEPLRIVAGPGGATLMVWGIHLTDLLQDLDHSREEDCTNVREEEVALRSSSNPLTG